MIPDIPWYITAIILGANLAAAGGVWYIVAAAATERKVRIGIAIFLFGWLGAALLLAPAPASLATRDPFYLTPLLPLFGLGPAAVLLAAVGMSPALRRTLGAMSLPAIHGVQLYRLIGAVFLLLMVQGQVPAHFALPAGWGDIAVGLGAARARLRLEHLRIAGSGRRGGNGDRLSRRAGARRRDGSVPPHLGADVRGAGFDHAPGAGVGQAGCGSRV